MNETTYTYIPYERNADHTIETDGRQAAEDGLDDMEIPAGKLVITFDGSRPKMTVYQEMESRRPQPVTHEAAREYYGAERLAQMCDAAAAEYARRCRQSPTERFRELQAELDELKENIPIGDSWVEGEEISAKVDEIAALDRNALTVTDRIIWHDIVDGYMSDSLEMIEDQEESWKTFMEIRETGRTFRGYHIYQLGKDGEVIEKGGGWQALEPTRDDMRIHLAGAAGIVKRVKDGHWSCGGGEWHPSAEAALASGTGVFPETRPPRRHWTEEMADMMRGLEKQDRFHGTDASGKDTSLDDPMAGDKRSGRRRGRGM